MTYSKRAQYHVEMKGAEIQEDDNGTFNLWLQRKTEAPEGYDVCHELQDAQYFADTLINATITVTIHVEGDQD